MGAPCPVDDRASLGWACRLTAPCHAGRAVRAKGARGGFGGSGRAAATPAPSVAQGRRIPFREPNVSPSRPLSGFRFQVSGFRFQRFRFQRFSVSAQGKRLSALDGKEKGRSERGRFPLFTLSQFLGHSFSPRPNHCPRRVITTKYALTRYNTTIIGTDPFTTRLGTPTSEPRRFSG